MKAVELCTDRRLKRSAGVGVSVSASVNVVASLHVVVLQCKCSTDIPCMFVMCCCRSLMQFLMLGKHYTTIIHNSSHYSRMVSLHQHLLTLIKSMIQLHTDQVSSGVKLVVKCS
jgi:hypothetical protein